MPRRCSRTGTVGQEEDGEDRQQQHSPAADQGRGCLTSGIRYHTVKCRYVLQEEVQIRTRFRVRGKNNKQHKRSEGELSCATLLSLEALEPKVRASRAVVLARSTASKGYDEQSLTGEDGRPDATSDVASSQQVRCTQSNNTSRAHEAEYNFSRQPSRPGASGRQPTQCTDTMAGRQARPQPN